MERDVYLHKLVLLSQELVLLVLHSQLLMDHVEEQVTLPLLVRLPYALMHPILMILTIYVINSNQDVLLMVLDAFLL